MGPAWAPRPEAVTRRTEPASACVQRGEPRAQGPTQLIVVTLMAMSLGNAIAADQTAGPFMGALTLSRIGIGWLADGVAAATLLRAGMTGAPVAALLLWLAPGPWGGGAGVVALGIALAAIYPLLVAGTPERLGEADTANAIGFQVAAAYLGAAALPGVSGVLAHRLGLDVIGPFLLGAAMLLLVLQALVARLPVTALRRPAAAPARG